MNPGRLLDRLKHPKTFLAFLFLVALVTYGYQFWRMGFYWDDWQAIFVGRMGDLSMYWPYYAYDRPISAWTYVLTYPLFGSHPALWQLYSIFLRWLTATGLWLSLAGLWPQRKQEVSWMALLFVLYPGFTQQPISVAYSQHWTSYALFTLSLALMVWSLCSRRRYWLYTILAGLMALLGVLSMEYFAGLELLRPVILWLLARREGEKGRRAVGRALKTWLPYALVFVLFVLYRFLLLPRLSDVGLRNTPISLQGLLAQPLQQMLHLAQNSLQDMLQFNLFAWTDTIRPDVVNFGSMLTLASWALGALIAAAAGFYLLRAQNSPEGGMDTRPSFAAQGILLGVLGVVLGGLPVWSTDRQAINGMWSDRFSLGPMFGVVILLVSLAYWLVNSPAKRALVLGFLAAIAIGAQMRNVNDYRKAVITQREALWQMVWRMPGLKPGTALLSTRQITATLPDYTTTYLANMIYAPGLKSTSLPYLLLSAPRYRYGLIPDFVDDQKIVYTVRTMRFEGNTSQAVALAYKSSSTSIDACVRVLTDTDRLTPKFQDVEKDLVKVSHPEQILRDPGQSYRPPEVIFGPEPAHDWCYYFEKADLARQFQDWAEVRKLDEEAAAKGLKTIYGPEMLPFIEGYANLGDWQKAKEYSDYAAHRTATMEPMLCVLWGRIENETPASAQRDSMLAAVRKDLQCPKK